MIFLKHSKTADVPKTPFLKLEFRIDFFYCSQNALVLSEPRGGYNHSQSVFKLVRFAISVLRNFDI